MHGIDVKLCQIGVKIRRRVCESVSRRFAAKLVGVWLCQLLTEGIATYSHSIHVFTNQNLTT